MITFPYKDKLGDLNPIDVMAETPLRLANLLEALSEHEIEHHPAPGKWNIREIVCHLADCELVWAWRLRYVYGDPNPVMQTFDQNNWAKAYEAYSLADAIDCFQSVRRWNLALIRSLDSVEMEKSLRHPARGQETLWTVIQIAAGHDLNHLERMESNRQQH